MALTALVFAALLTQGPTTLKIHDDVVGKGPAVEIGDYVTVHYTGKLSDGNKFDSSVGGPPFSFLVGAGSVIKGWDQGIPGMRVNGKRTLTIPPDLAYGAAGSGEIIPPNATLIFNVDLLKVEHSKVITTAKGTGEGAAFGDTVDVYYTGRLANGKQFDSSANVGKPLPVRLGKRVIPGFSQGLLGMKLGEKRTVTIPASLAYGNKPKMNDKGEVVIPPNSVLVFDLELVRFIKRAGQ